METDPNHKLEIQQDELDRAHVVQLRGWKLLCLMLALGLLVGVVGWQTAAHEQNKARTNATVAKAGEALADQLAVICANRDPKVRAYAAKYQLCQQANDVKSAAGQINSASAAPVPVQTVVVPGGTATSWAVSNVTSTTTVPGPTLTALQDRPVVLTVTDTATAPGATTTVPGPVSTQVVPGPTSVVTVPGPVSTQVVTVAGDPVTQTVTAPPVVVTQTATVPGPTETITVPGPERTITVTATPEPSTTTATDPGPTVTETYTPMLRRR